jgi:hypothetical protein
MQKAREQDSEVANLATRLFPQGSDMAFPRYSAQSLDPANHPLTAWLMTKLEPDVLSRDLAGSIGFVHRREASDDIYFLVNLRDTAIRFHGSFRVDSTYPHALDPETGNSAPVFEYRRESGRTTVSYPLAPRQAVFIVFRPEKVPAVAAHNVDSVLALSPSRATAEVSSNGMFFVNAGGERLVASVTGLPAPLEVAGPWQLTVPGVGSRTVDVLRDWTEYEEFARFSGTAAYKTQFALPEAWRRNGQRLVLEMEQVHEVAEVYLNNKAAGVAWKAPFQVTLPEPLAAKNFLEIHVTNLLFNRMLGAERLPPPYVPLARIYPQPLTSGLVGRVRIRPVRTIQLAP